jgi:hypothetical protein
VIRPDRAQVESTLAGVEQALGGDGPVDLTRLGFWRAVAAVKRRPEWVSAYATRIGEIDRRAFARAVRPIIPIGVGAGILAAAGLVGVALVVIDLTLPQPLRGLIVLAGTGALLWSTHDLAHLVVGWVDRLQFVGWFVDGPTRLQPGLKVEYGSYLRTPPSARAWFHASGAIVTKLVPFAVLAATVGRDLPGWTRVALIAIGVGTVLSDLLFSINNSDWKKFRREMKVARELRA